MFFENSSLKVNSNFQSSVCVLAHIYAKEERVLAFTYTLVCMCACV